MCLGLPWRWLKVSLLFLPEKFVQKTAVAGVVVWFLKKVSLGEQKMKRDAMDVLSFKKNFWNFFRTFSYSPLFVVVFGADESHKKVALQGSPLPMMSKSNHQSTSFFFMFCVAALNFQRIFPQDVLIYSKSFALQGLR